MPHPKQVKHYPAEFFDILTRLQRDPQVQIRMECESKRAAYAQRGQIYAFKKAIEADPGLNELFPDTASVMMMLEGSTLIILHRDHSPAALRVRKALADLPPLKDD